ncbi:MAG: hypothetical protein ABIR96_04035 [Bdellovibrionota bacterium]
MILRRHETSFILSLCVLFAFVACNKKKEPDPISSASGTTSNSTVPGEVPADELVLPLGIEDPVFAMKWKQALARRSLESPPNAITELPVSIRDTSIPEAWRLSTESWLAEAGSLYRLGFSSGSGIQDLRTWTRILQETQTLIEDPQPATPFRASIKFFSAFSDPPNHTRYAPLNRYVEVQTSPQASPLGREACEVLRKWFSARQLLAGRSVRAFNRNKETIVMLCSLVSSEESPSQLPFLQVAELPLPLVEPTRREPLFKTPADLIRPDKLQILQEMN